MRQDQRSTCPISSALELVGDRWTLLIARDLMFAGKRRFREFLQSEEAISSNVLADRLATLVERGILRKESDPDHAQKAIYCLTEMGIDLLPIVVALSVWSQKHDRTTRRPEAAKLLQGGTKVLKQIELQLRRDHGLA